MTDHTDIKLSRADRDDRIIRGDWHETQGDMTEATTLRTESAIGARVIRGPGCHGYHPMMAIIAKGLGLTHDDQLGILR